MHNFRLDHETSPSDHHTRQSDQNPDHKAIRPSSRPDHQTIRSPPPIQTTSSDNNTRPEYTSLDCSASKSAQHTQVLVMVQVRCIHCGLGQGGYIELWMNLAKHTFHTPSAWRFRILFRLNLTVVRLASGVPWAGRVLPFPFSLDGFLCRCSVSNKFGF